MYEGGKKRATYHIRTLYYQTYPNATCRWQLLGRVNFFLNTCVNVSEAINHIPVYLITMGSFNHYRKMGLLWSMGLLCWSLFGFTKYVMVNQWPWTYPALPFYKRSPSSFSDYTDASSSQKSLNPIVIYSNLALCGKKCKKS